MKKIEDADLTEIYCIKWTKLFMPYMKYEYKYITEYKIDKIYF